MLIAIFTVYSVTYIYFTVRGIVLKGINVAYPELFRTVAMAGLFYLIWIGYRWARWVAVGLMLFLSLWFIGPMIRTLHPFFIATFLALVVPSALLSFSKSIQSFLESQRERRQLR
jgi:threonine/homoserine/homoserine lactone efflux protein